jgi:hypothetical protein
MLDKIRLHARGALPPDYRANMGEARPTLFDARCCRFLGVPYDELRARTLQGGCDEEIPLWAEARGAARTGHFMKETLLQSQFEALEEPAEALSVNAAQAKDVIADRIRRVFGLPQ